jgi:hypothetical protein
MDTSFLEQYYEQVILPQFKDSVSFEQINWKDHGKVGLDSWAHYFEDENGVEYILLYEDYPTGEYLNDNLSHTIVKISGEPTLQTTLSNNKIIDNIVGYFTLYKENR